MASNDELTKKYHALFLGTAIYNWFVAVSMLQPAGAYKAMNISPVPAQDNTLHLCCLVIGAFGFVYFWASKDFPRHADLVWFGMALKAGNLVLSVVDIWLGFVTWQLLLLLLPDAVLVGIFYNALQQVKKAKES